MIPFYLLLLLPFDDVGLAGEGVVVTVEYVPPQLTVYRTNAGTLNIEREHAGTLTINRQHAGTLEVHQ